MRQELLSRECFKGALEIAGRERGWNFAARYIDEYLPGGVHWDATVKHLRGSENAAVDRVVTSTRPEGVKKQLLEAIEHEIELFFRQTSHGDGSDAPHFYTARELAEKVIGVVAGFVEWVQTKMSVEAAKLQTATAQPTVIGKSDRKYFEQLGTGTEADPYRFEPIGEGELKMQVSHDAEHVRLDFGMPAAWIAMPKAQALTFAFTVLDHCGVSIEMQQVPGTPKAPA